MGEGAKPGYSGSSRSSLSRVGSGVRLLIVGKLGEVDEERAGKARGEHLGRYAAGLVSVQEKGEVGYTRRLEERDLLV